MLFYGIQYDEVVKRIYQSWIEEYEVGNDYMLDMFITFEECMR